MTHSLPRANIRFRSLLVCLSLGGVVAVMGCSSSNDANDSDSEAGSPGVGATSNGGGVSSGGSKASNGGGRGGLGGATNTAGTNATAGNAGSLGVDVTACTNGLDDDDDGLVDGFDPECSGPLDSDEGSFATGIPGDNRDPKWQDCFFDGNSGAGDDGCRYATGCLTGDLPSTHKDCSLTQACIDYCRPLTPNGCDCFGCCTVQLADGEQLDILTGTSCSLDKATDASACPTCTKSTACGNSCGTCELCPGKTLADLPASCVPDEPPVGEPDPDPSPDPDPTPEPDPTPPTPVNSCDGGETRCGPDLPACSSTQYCSLGCCIEFVR